MPAKITDFPDICDIIYDEKVSVDGIRSKYIERLRNTSNIYNSLYANKLEESAEMLSPDKLKELEHEFSDFKDYMQKWTVENKVHLTIKYRQKDFIRYNDKIRMKLVTGFPLDKILDLIGFRITLRTPAKDTIGTVELCYQVLAEVINFFVTKKHAIPLEAEPRTDSDFDLNTNPDIIIPKTNLILENFENNVKDYIMFPKKRGYQSLHMALRMPNGLTFEVQIRTFFMDVFAEKGKASHLLYEEERKSESDICLDYSKIQIPGFAYLPSGEICDTIGLVRSIDPFNYL